MKRWWLFVGLTIGLFASGCYRTTYTNLTPIEKLEAARSTPVTHDPTNGWQHFFIYGWVPSERVIQTEKICGGPDRVEEIYTEQTFVQGLIEAFASAYVNIYSPWTGHVRCAGDPPLK